MSPYPAMVRTSGLAVAALVMGILFLWGLGSVLALVFGYRSRAEIAGSNGQLVGRGMATAGIVLGWLGVFGTTMFFAILAAYL